VRANSVAPRGWVASTRRRAWDMGDRSGSNFVPRSISDGLLRGLAERLEQLMQLAPAGSASRRAIQENIDHVNRTLVTRHSSLAGRRDNWGARPASAHCLCVRFVNVHAQKMRSIAGKTQIKVQRVSRMQRTISVMGGPPAGSPGQQAGQEADVNESSERGLVRLPSLCCCSPAAPAARAFCLRGSCCGGYRRWAVLIRPRSVSGWSV
jgi:hypothetical protein